MNRFSSVRGLNFSKFDSLFIGGIEFMIECAVIYVRPRTKFNFVEKLLFSTKLRYFRTRTYIMALSMRNSMPPMNWS
jgi:hypothetical protein